MCTHSNGSREKAVMRISWRDVRVVAEEHKRNPFRELENPKQLRLKCQRDRDVRSSNVIWRSLQSTSENLLCSLCLHRPFPGTQSQASVLGMATIHLHAIPWDKTLAMSWRAICIHLCRRFFLAIPLLSTQLKRITNWKSKRITAADKPTPGMMNENVGKSGWKSSTPNGKNALNHFIS